MTDHTRTIVVVGAGLAGLTAAATAATTGARVTMLEARSHAGGRARTADVDGFLFNQGAHALYRGGPAWEVLTGFGITPQGREPDAKHATGRRADGRIDRLPGSATGLVRSRLIGPSAKFELARRLARPARMAQTVQPGTSLQEWIDTTSRNADVRAMLTTLSRVSTYCCDLSAFDAAAGVAQIVQAMTHGVLYLDRGWQQLVDGLLAVARARGVTVDTAAKVLAVDVRSDGVTVRTSSGEREADAVVLAAGGPGDADTLLRGVSPAVTRAAEETRPVVVSTLDVALRSLPVPTRRITFGIDEPTYLSVHTPFARLAPEGGEVAHLIWYGDAVGDPRARLESLLDDAQPGWRAQAVTQRYGHRLVVTHDRPRPGLGLAGRMPVTVRDLPGVFVAGDWVGPHGLLADATFASGRDAGLAAARTGAAEPVVTVS